MKIISRALALACLLAGASAVAGVNSWTVGGPGGGLVTAVAVQPGNSQVVLLGSANKLYRSTDGGTNWAITRGDTANTVTDILFLPSSTRAYAAGGLFYSSDDAGLTWTSSLLPGTVGALFVGLNPDANRTLFVVGNDARLYRSSDSSQASLTWTQLQTPPWAAYSSVTAFTVDPVTPNTLYIAIYGTGGGLYKSVDGGVNWSGPAVSGPGVAALSVVEQVVVKPGNSSVVLAATNMGLFYSTNAGATWTEQFPSRPIFSAAFDPANTNNVVIATFQGQVYRSNTGGATYTAPLTGPLLGAKTVPRLVFDPGTSGKLFAASSEGLLVSTNGGAAFTPNNNGIREESLTSVGVADDGSTYMSFSPGPSGVYRRTAGGYQPVNNLNLQTAVNTTFDMQRVVPAAQDSQKLFVLNGPASLVRSLDGGATWSSPAPEFFLSRQIWALARDPTRVDTTYAATPRYGVWRTLNGGTSWSQRSTLTDISCASILIDPVNTDVIYAGCSVADDNYGVYKSVNAGADWTFMTPSTFGFPKIVAIDPANHNIVYATFSFSLQKSTNAGASWTPMAFTSPELTGAQPGDLLIDPVLPTTMFGVFYSQTVQGFARTVDGGTSWEFVRWQGGPLGPRVAALDPQRPNMIIMGSTGSGVHEYEVAPDLDMTLSAPGATVQIGSSLNATVRVRNLGPMASSGSTLRVTLPAWLTPAPPAGCTLATVTLTCPIAAFRATDAPRDIVIPLTAAANPANGSIDAQLTTHETDAVSTNNTATIPLASIAVSDLGVTIAGGGLTVLVNGAITFTATVSNAGPTTAPNARLTLQVPANVSLQSVTSTTGTCTTSGATTTCSLNSLASAANATITFTGTAVTAGSAAFTAAALGDTSDTIAANNSAVTTFTISSPASSSSGGGSGKKKGGGRFDWAALLLLGALAGRKMVPGRSSRAGRAGRCRAGKPG